MGLCARPETTKQETDIDTEEMEKYKTSNSQKYIRTGLIILTSAVLVSMFMIKISCKYIYTISLIITLTNGSRTENEGFYCTKISTPNYSFIKHIEYRIML